MKTPGHLGIVRLMGDQLASLRADCFLRDNFLCQECGRKVTWKMGHMAHIVGRGRGGSDEITNVRTLCGICHMVGEHVPKSVRGKK